MADSWREQWLRQQRQRAEQQEQQRRQRQQQEQQRRQERLDAAAERLHEFCTELLVKHGLTEQHLLVLLAVESEWYAGDCVYVHLAE